MDTSKVMPTVDRVLVRREVLDRQTQSGIFLPEQAEDRRYPEVGRVLAVGPDVKDESLLVDSRVIFDRYAGTEIEWGREGDYVVMDESEIMAIVGDDTAVTWVDSL